VSAALEHAIEDGLGEIRVVEQATEQGPDQSFLALLDPEPWTNGRNFRQGRGQNFSGALTPELSVRL